MLFSCYKANIVKVSVKDNTNIDNSYTYYFRSFEGDLTTLLLINKSYQHANQGHGADGTFAAFSYASDLLNATGEKYFRI